MSRHRFEVGCEVGPCRELIEQAFSFYARRYARACPELVWLDDTHAALTMSVRGLLVRVSVALTPGALEVEVDAPLPLRVFRAAALRRVEAEIARWTSRSA